MPTSGKCSLSLSLTATPFLQLFNYLKRQGCPFSLHSTIGHLSDLSPLNSLCHIQWPPFHFSPFYYSSSLSILAVPFFSGDPSLEGAEKTTTLTPSYRVTVFGLVLSHGNRIYLCPIAVKCSTTIEFVRSAVFTPVARQNSPGALNIWIMKKFWVVLKNVDFLRYFYATEMEEWIKTMVIEISYFQFWKWEVEGLHSYSDMKQFHSVYLLIKRLIYS